MGGRKKDIAARILANTAYQLSRQRITNDNNDHYGDTDRKGTKRSASTEVSASLAVGIHSHDDDNELCGPRSLHRGAPRSRRIIEKRV